MPTIDSFFLTDPGQKRANNEDCVGANEPTDSRQLKQSGRLYVVADGLGGHQMGEKASKYAVDTLLDLYYEAPEIPPEKRLRDIIQQVNQNLIATARRELGSGEKMATTVVAAVLRENTVQIANVGDSRAYLIRDNEIHQVSRDHSFVGELIRSGTITEEEAQQSRYRNRLTRSLGGGDVNVEVDVTPPITLRPGDILILCTDGLTLYASSRDLLAYASRGSAQSIVERLVRFANVHGGSDNITVAVVKYGSKSALPAMPSWKIIAAAGAGALILFLLAFFGLRFAGRLATSTATPTLTASPLPILTLTPEPTLTATLSPTETSLPLEITASPTPVETMVDCQYTVQSDEIAGRIVEMFGTDFSHLFRQDGTQDDFAIINLGEILILNDISNDACVNGGGESISPTTIP